MPRTTASSETPLQAVNLRVRIDTQSLIDRAANMLGRSRSDFMIDASQKAAENAILDQRVISVSPELYSDFLAMLDRPAQAYEQLRRPVHTPEPRESQCTSALPPPSKTVPCLPNSPPAPPHPPIG